jgi:ribose-phosphate pyrophosphokinase
MTPGELAVFGLHATGEYARRVAAHLGMVLAPHEEREFDDGEHKVRPLGSVRGKDVYLIQSMYADAARSVNDKLCRALFMSGALRDAGAGRVTLVVPYLCYARKERQTQARDPVTTRYVAGMLESAGIDTLVALDVHSLAAFQNAFRCHTEHLDARALFVRYLQARLDRAPVVVVSPDIGGTKRADALRAILERATGGGVGLASMVKRRALGVLSGGDLVGEVSGRIAVIVDDMIVTGGTLARAIAACRDAGATAVYALATHGLFLPGAVAPLASAGAERIAVTDTVPPFRVAGTVLEGRVDVVDSTPLVAEAIRRLHAHESIVALLEPW